MDKVIEYAKEHLNFNFETGEIKWVKYPKRYNKINKPIYAGRKHYSGYIIITLMNKPYMAHRLIWAVYNNEWPHGCLDHIDGNKSNNSINNLRMATRNQNAYNSKVKSSSSSGYKNVQWDSETQKWRVRVRVDGKRYHIGRFQDVNEARLAANDFMIKNHKEFARIS